MSQIRRRPVRRKRKSDKRRRGTPSPTRRLANLERLEDRVLLAADFNAWHNYINPLDVDQDSHVVPLDGLIVLSDLNRFGSISLRDRAVSLLHSSGGEGEGATIDAPTAMVDVNGDGNLTPVDLLSIFDALNSGEGEGEFLASLRLTAVEDIVSDVDLNEESPYVQNTPRPIVGTAANPVMMGETFRIEVRTADLRDDDNTDPNDDVMGQFGVYTVHPDIWWDDATALTVPLQETPIYDRPWALDLSEKAENNLLPSPWLPGIQVPDVFAVPLSMRNGDYNVAGTYQPEEPYLFDNFPAIDVSTPGLINSTGATTTDVDDSLNWGTDVRFNPDTMQAEFYNPKKEAFVYDMTLRAESIIGQDDTETTTEGIPVLIPVLANDGLVSGGVHVLNVGPNDTFVPNPSREVGKDLLLLGETGYDALGATDDGTGHHVPNDLLMTTGVSVLVEEIPGRELSIVSFTQPAGGKGTVEQVGNQFRFTPDPNYDFTVTETDTFEYVLSDGQGNTKTVEVTVTIEPADAEPQITAPASIEMNEDEVFQFVAGNMVSVEELDDQNMNVQLVASSAIDIAAGSGVNITVDDRANGQLVFNGTEQQVNDALAGLTYEPDANFFGDGTLEITVQDLEADNTTPIHTVMHTVDITINPVNDPPQLSVPGEQTVLTIDLPLTLSEANGNEITVNDVFDKMFAPGGDFVVQVSFSIGQGELSLTDATGLTSVTGSGTTDFVIQGTTAAINTALAAGLEIDNLPPDGGTPYSLLVSLDDLGNIGDPIATVDDSVIISVILPQSPLAIPDSYNVLEDSGAANLDVLINDYDYEGILGGSGLIITAIDDANTQGTVTIVNEGIANETSILFTPFADFSGVTTFTYTTNDEFGEGDGPTTATVTVTVEQVNDEPSFTASGDPAAVLEDTSGTITVPAWITGFQPDADPMATPDPESTQVPAEYIISNVSDETLFAALPAVDPATGDLTYSLNPDANGNSTFDIQVRDNGGTANGGDDTSQAQTFTIEVIAVNDAPMFTATDPPAVDEDAPAQTLPGWASGFDPGPSNESGQTLVGYTVSEVSDTSLFSVGPTVNANGDLTYTPAANQWGNSTFRVTVQDSGGTTDGGVDTYSEVFTITINPINDKPSFTANAIPNPTSTEDDGPFSMQLIASFDAGPNENGENGQTAQEVLQYNVELTSGAALFSQAPVVSNTGELTYSLSPNASGTATFNLTVQDNGGTPGVDTSDPQAFTIVVQSENDAPVNLIDGDDTFGDHVQSTDDGVDLAFDTANGNLLQVTDVDDDGSASYTLDLTVAGGDTKGTLSLPNAPGTLTTFTGDDSANVQLVGTRADINTAIEGMVFQPADGLNNEDVLISFSASDGGASGDVGGIETDTDTITISVAPINDDPIAQDDDITTSEGAAVEFNVMDDNGNGADSPGPNESFQEIEVISFDTTGTVGTVELLNAETGEFRYTPPNADYNGTTTFSYTIQDNGQSRIDGVIQDDFKEDTATVTITVTEVNDAPTAEDDLLLIPPSQSTAGAVVRFPVSDVLGNDSPGPANESGQTLSVVAVGNSEKGATVSLDDQGTSDPSDDEIVYTIPAGFDHVDRIEVTISDNGTTDGELDAREATSIAEIRDVVRTKVSGYAYVDADQQGDMDPGEFGIGGTLITLSGTDISGDSFQLTTRTDGNGYYEFNAIMPNGAQPYVLTQAQPMGWLGGIAVPGENGGVSDTPDRISFSLPVTGVGDDPENSEAANYNFAEWGLMSTFAGMPAANLLHSGSFGGPPADAGIMFLADAVGELQWYIDIGGWTDYVPGVRSQANGNVYELPTNGLGTTLTDMRTDNQHDVTWANENYYSSYRNGFTMGRILESAADNGLPSNDAGGEGEGFEDYVSAVDSIFGEGGLE